MTDISHQEAELYDIPLFEGLSQNELEWLIEHSYEVTLSPGELFFQEGEPDHRYSIVLEGEMQIVRTMNGAPRVMGTTPRGIMGGELNLLNNNPVSLMTSRAILPTRLMVFDESAFREIFARVPLLGSRILKIATERMGGFATAVTQTEKMAALGKFSAGLAHELNNPASAARRSSKALYELLPQLQHQTLMLCSLGLSDPQLESLLTVPQDAARNAAQTNSLSPLERSDREDEIGDWLEQRGVSNGYDMAAVFVNVGVQLDDLEGVAVVFPAQSVLPILNWMHLALQTATLLNEIHDSTERISHLVRAVKEYTYMDQGKIQEVDLHKGLDNTLRVLWHKAKHINIVREYDPELPHIMGSGGELNQVWTNLLDNAIDAVKDAPDPTVRLITRCESEYVMVEVNDNGVGIPEADIPHLFEPFFTTKAFGQGTGLGLDISYRVIQNHQGTIEVWSQPGETRFIVRLPIQTAAVSG
jgi:signal transduction histidine kinase